MTVSTHVYSATLLGTPERPLDVREGTIDLDAGRAPHVQGTLTIALPDLDTLTALDPRLTVRIRITVEATYPAGPVARTFNLGLRTRDASQGEATITLGLASDETLLSDYAPLTDDSTPLSLQASLRGIVNYVLGKAIPGAVLQPGRDVPIRALSNSVNLVPNPRAGINLTDWSASPGTLGRSVSGGPPGSPTIVSVVSNGSAQMIAYARTNLVVEPGTIYRMSVYFIATAGVPVTMDAVLYDAAGNILLDVPEAPGSLANTWTRKYFIFTAPANAVRANLRFFSTTAIAVGGQINVTGIRLTEVSADTTDTEYFDGDTVDTTDYRYDWGGPAHAATSSRTVLRDAPTPEAMVWKAGQDALDFLVPLVQVAGFRLVCDEARAWTLRDETYIAPGGVNIRYAVNMIEAADTIDRTEGLWFDAAVTRYTWTDADGVVQQRTDSYALRTPYSRLWTFEKASPYPGPGFSQYAVRRAQGRGREVSARTVADWRAQAEQPAAVTLGDDRTQTGITQAILFDLGADEMTITTRTVDTPAGAIDLLGGTIDALVGTIDSL